MSKTLNDDWKEKVSRIDAKLNQLLPEPSVYPSIIQEAMRYSVLNGGKRFRPVLALSVCEMLTGSSEEAILAACAVEFIHSYSLIHDDLPCMDNDDYRRGQLSCHKKYGEAIALLAGDGLLTLAFEVISLMPDGGKVKRILNEVARASGTSGMVGGQVADMLAINQEMDIAKLDYIHVHKTGQLIRASCLVGAIAAGAPEEDEKNILKYGEYLGFAFQLVDDILDSDGYMKLMNSHQVTEKATEMVLKAKQAVARFKRNEYLLQIADFVLSRKG
ncbi:MAG: hypothetical protein A3G33_08830 [Omnitrophica bacterium RIFCSPLOWO2_12_FULL_44_17]|uniref:Polyprenyl synthetase n=1 Tax=Candidatus Danuiimicrobium aquiferis TaxID=1801832 RepID=A0A1G1L1B7_9BACT|nr:MAG: hypothetical protein A3B72_08170 [Omnitrophica bacterium RIFCSPHIGHO2_02_FULL_45_28]OGW88515.1 MAG: hypothetical protein A3E74_06640 [Omnitrophica bacterium RIFCSPHIGHO2_12_FULL_44_12]OGW98931.1 MAG: hypothetical protein A3G33_08830 [Omnitrophica bacterium RIFCSPLOWO2_12_FULL_44_17]OGX01779.1 MAG: hypothetical protein A3J12_04955 [Omnitrophica bacterium RIFCSPLOWO2_02_FULL_44_11]